MFLPNSRSFLLVRSGTSKVFLPNSRSFLLVKSVISKPVIQEPVIQSEIQEPETSLSRLRESSPDQRGRVPTVVESRPWSRILDWCRSGDPRLVSIGRSSIVANREIPLAAGPSSLSSDSRRNLFLPNSRSFLLVKSAISKPVIQSAIAESATSLPSSSSPDSGKPTIGDKNKRTFLKAAGIAGASLAATLLLPKKADALIMGSSPTTGVVGVKNSTNARINPATEETVNSLLKPSNLALNAGVLDVKVTSTSGAGSSSFSNAAGTATSGLVDVDRHVQVDVLSSALPSTASTETTLQTISFGGKKYALRLTTVGSIDYVGEADTGTATSSALWRAKKVDSTSGIIITWADGNANFDNVATDLTALTYS